MNYSNPLLVSLRNGARQAGLLRPLLREYRKLFPLDREEKFEEAILSHISPGDTVWDVGANVGYFTLKMSDAVGSAGQVVAFEPAPSSHQVLTERAAHLSNVVVEQVAMGDVVGTTDLFVSAKPTDPSNGLFSDGDGTSVEVRSTTGCAYLSDHPERAPNVVKIDVEGFEYEVLKGLDDLVRSPSPLALFIEVHFGILDRRGMDEAPDQIVRLLRECGFKTRWLSISHLVAVK